MPLFNWGVKYSIGVHSIDLQHKKLFDLVNDLNNAIVNKKNKPLALKETLDNLITYIQNHFLYEEKLLTEFDYPESENHFLEHKRLIEELDQLIKRFQRGDLQEPLELLNFTIEWLQHHILEIDTKYGQFLIGKGVQ